MDEALAANEHEYEQKSQREIAINLFNQLTCLPIKELILYLEERKAEGCIPRESFLNSVMVFYKDRGYMTLNQKKSAILAIVEKMAGVNLAIH